MRAMLLDGKKKFVWTQVADPNLKQDELIIDVKAAAVNRADLLQRAGTYPSPEGWPEWMGLEVAGIVSATGAKCHRFKVGDEVCALLGGGGYAEKVAVVEDLVMPIPAGLSFVEAASLPEVYATCYLNLFIEGQYHKGETLFFPAAASGLASAGIPMAKAFGAYVITSVRDTETVEKVRKLGADVIVDSSKEDVVAVLKKEADKGHPVDVAIDCLGGEVLGKIFENVNQGCRWVIVSTLAGTEATIPLRALLTRGIVLKGSMLRKRAVSEKKIILDSLVEKVWPKLIDKSIVPSIYRVMPIFQAEQAHSILQEGQSVGKIVLTIA